MRMPYRADVDNTAFRRNVYSGAAGMTTGNLGGADTPYTLGIFGTQTSAGNFGGLRDPNTARSGQAGDGTDGAPAAGGFLSKPFAWWIAFAVALFALMWGAQRWGSEGEDFKTIRLSMYNILVISLAAILGISLFKILFTKLTVPGLSDLIAAV